MDTVKAFVEFLVEVKREEDWIISDIHIYRLPNNCIEDNTVTRYNADGIAAMFGIDEDEWFPFLNVYGFTDEQWNELALRVPNGFKLV